MKENVFLYCNIKAEINGFILISNIENVIIIINKGIATTKKIVMKLFFSNLRTFLMLCDKLISNIYGGDAFANF